ncbi:MAG: alpha-mannosidase, partial [Chloroflexi bacterium]|nr:alpha-mannosidase [Chloroflexota bacterium]
SSIHRVYEEAEAAYGAVLDVADQVRQEACGTLVEKASGLVIFNSLSWPRTALITLPEGYSGLADAQGQPCPTQKIGDRVFAEVTLPPCGWRTYAPAEANAIEGTPTVQARPDLLENEYLRVRFDKNGEITSIYDKEADCEWAEGTCNAFRMYKDVPGLFDAWDIDSMYPQTPVSLESNAAIEVTAQGP